MRVIQISTGFTSRVFSNKQNNAINNFKANNNLRSLKNDTVSFSGYLDDFYGEMYKKRDETLRKEESARRRMRVEHTPSVDEFTLGDFVQGRETDYAREKRQLAQKMAPCVANNDVISAFKCLNIMAKRNDDGTLTISHYRTPGYGVPFSKVGVDENWLFKDVKVIEDDAWFEGSELTDLRDTKLESIEGDAYFEYSGIKYISDNLKIGGNAYFWHSNIKNRANAIVYGEIFG